MRAPGATRVLIAAIHDNQLPGVQTKTRRLHASRRERRAGHDIERAVGPDAECRYGVAALIYHVKKTVVGRDRNFLIVIVGTKDFSLVVEPGSPGCERAAEDFVQLAIGWIPSVSQDRITID